MELWKEEKKNNDKLAMIELGWPKKSDTVVAQMQNY